MGVGRGRTPCPLCRRGGVSGRGELGRVVYILALIVVISYEERSRILYVAGGPKGGLGWRCKMSSTRGTAGRSQKSHSLTQAPISRTVRTVNLHDLRFRLRLPIYYSAPALTDNERSMPRAKYFSQNS